MNEEFNKGETTSRAFNLSDEIKRKSSIFPWASWMWYFWSLVSVIITGTLIRFYWLEVVIGKKYPLKPNDPLFSNFYASIAVGMLTGVATAVWDIYSIRRDAEFFKIFYGPEWRNRKFEYEIIRKVLCYGVTRYLIYFAAIIVSFKMRLAAIPLFFSIDLLKFLFARRAGAFYHELSDLYDCMPAIVEETDQDDDEIEETDDEAPDK